MKPVFTVWYILFFFPSFPAAQQDYAYRDENQSHFVFCKNNIIKNTEAEPQSISSPESIIEHFIAAGNDKEKQRAVMHPEYKPYGATVLFNSPLPFSNEKKFGVGHIYDVEIDFKFTYSPESNQDSISFVRFNVFVENKEAATNLLILYFDSKYNRWYVQGEHPYVKNLSFIQLQSVFRKINRSYSEYLFADNDNETFEKEGILKREYYLFTGAIDIEKLSGKLTYLKTRKPELYELIAIPYLGWRRE